MTTTVCTCDPGTFANGWHETRCADCAAADLRQWDRAWAFQAAVRDNGGSVVFAATHARLQWALWDYLGMDRAGAWR